MTFSKKDSLAIKGIAILMMLMHHNFMSIPYFQKYSVSFAPFSQTSVVQLAIFCKICVGIFVFISGYGLTLSLKKINSNYKLYIYEIDKYIINRLISLLSGYWFIVISSNIICQLINGRTYTIYFSEGIKRGIISLVINFFGLSELCGLDQLNGTWWYMSFAVLIVFLVPIAIILYKKIGIFISLFLCILIPRVLKITNNNMTNWVLAVLLGIIFAEFDLLVKLKSISIIKSVQINKIIKFLINTIIIALCILSYTKMPNEIQFDIIPIFVVYYCYDFIIDIKGIRKMLIYLGKHSMNIFLTHTFIRYYYLSDFIYSFKHFILINLVLLILSLILSILIEYLKKIIGYEVLIKKLRDFIISKYDKCYRMFGQVNN